MDNLSISVGRDYASGLHGRFEYAIFDGESLIARKGLFKSSAQAKREAIRAATELQNQS